MREAVFNPIIDSDCCFECGGLVEEMHHVVPVVLGGKRVIPLCETCHGKVHNLHRKGHVALINAGLTKKRLKGEVIGTPPFGMRVGADGKTLVLDEKEQAIINQLCSMRATKMTIRKIVSEAKSIGLVGRSGKPLGIASIHHIVTQSPR